MGDGRGKWRFLNERGNLNDTTDDNELFTTSSREESEEFEGGIGEGMLAKISPIVDFLSNGWLTNDGH